MGTYSGFTSQGSGGRGPGGPGGPPPDGFGPGGPPPDGRGPGGPGGFGGGRRGPGGPRQIDETRFLRGIQVTGKQGLVEFASVYPGWYKGRTIHIHMKVHLGGQANETYQGGHISHTGQLYFPEDITNEIALMKPYEANSGVHRTLHSEDGIYKSQHGELSLVTLDRLQKGKNEGGFIALATLAIDPDLTPAPVGGGGGGRGRGRGPQPF